jgi:hypothetical protein
VARFVIILVWFFFVRFIRLLFRFFVVIVGIFIVLVQLVLVKFVNLFVKFVIFLVKFINFLVKLLRIIVRLVVILAKIVKFVIARLLRHNIILRHYVVKRDLCKILSEHITELCTTKHLLHL